jgi:dTDP-4-dehydrorhamnose reductase
VTKVLVFGKSGQLAYALARGRWPESWQVYFASRDEADLAKKGQAAACIRLHKPGIVVNAAAYTSADKAESDIETAHAVNALAPGEMAQVCADLGIPLATVSTDYVFDGRKPDAYVEDDSVVPLSVYGATKVEGERLVRAVLAEHLILRTSWVFSAMGNNFVRTMLRLAVEQPLVRVVHDQKGKPTGADDLAQAIIAACGSLSAGSNAYGTYHIANAVATTWYEFAVAIFDGAKARGGRGPDKLEAITTAEYPTPTKRPANSELSTAKFEQTFGFTLRPWREALNDVLDELYRSHPGEVDRVTS